jgi:hypothetical protein
MHSTPPPAARATLTVVAALAASALLALQIGPLLPCGGLGCAHAHLVREAHRHLRVGPGVAAEGGAVAKGERLFAP